MASVILGVCGGIAAYKAAELARALIQRNCQVQTVMTEGAQEFIRPLSFAALTNRKVITGMFDSSASTSEIRCGSRMIGLPNSQTNAVAELRGHDAGAKG